MARTGNPNRRPDGINLDEPKPRRYTSPRRSRQADQTRGEILDAAARLFARNGWAGTTLAAIAAEAEVAVETIYLSFKSKKTLLQAAMDFAIAGDAEPVPMQDRQRMALLTEGPPDERLRQLIDWVGEVYRGGVVGVWFAMLEAAASDQEVAGWCDQHEQRRRDTTAALLPVVLGRTVEPAALDAIWVVSSMEIYAKLTRQRSWTHEQWRDWLIWTIYGIK